MSFVSPTIGRAGRAARPVFRLRSRQSRHLNSDARSLPIDPPVRRRIPPGRKAAVYVASAALITVGWLAWDASAYAKTARKQTPDILLSSMSTGDVIKSYLAFAYLSSASLSDSEEGSILAPIRSRLTSLALSHQFSTGETLQEVFKVAQSLNEKRIGSVVTFADPLRLAGEGEEAEEAAVKTATKYKDEILEAVELASQVARQSGPARNRISILFKLSGLLPDPDVLVRRAERLAEERRASSETRRLLVQDGDWEKLWSIDHANGWQNIRDVFMLDDAYEAVREIVQQSRQIGLDVYIEREDDNGDRQSTIEVLTDKLMSDFNKPEDGLPVVHVDMRSASMSDGEKIMSQVERARQAGYSLGIKLEQETDSKTGTYVAIARQVLEASRIPQTSGSRAQTEVKPFFATHDEDSVISIQKELAKMSVGSRVCSQITLGQVYGRRDDLTEAISDSMEKGATVEPAKILLRKADMYEDGREIYKLERSRMAKEILHRSSW